MKFQLSAQPEWVQTDVMAIKVPLILATKVLAVLINNQPPATARRVWMLRLTVTVFPEMVMPLGTLTAGGGVTGFGSVSSADVQEVKNATPKVLMMVAKPAFSINFLREAERLPERSVS